MRILACLALGLCAGCIANLPPIEIDASVMPVGGSISVAACLPGESNQECGVNHTVPILKPGESSHKAGIYDIPADVTQLPLEITDSGSGECLVFTVFRKRNDQKITVAGGTKLSITCEQDGDCGPQSSCN